MIYAQCKHVSVVTASSVATDAIAVEIYGKALQSTRLFLLEIDFNFVKLAKEFILLVFDGKTEEHARTNAYIYIHTNKSRVYWIDNTYATEKLENKISKVFQQ